MVRSSGPTSATHDGEFNAGRCKLAPVVVDILNPFAVLFEPVGGETDHFHIAFFEVVGTACDLTELGGADGREVARVREEDCLENGQRI